MAEKSPESYKKFINDQLNGDGTKDMLKQLGLGGGILGAKQTRENVKSSESKNQGQGSTSNYKATIPPKKRSVLTTTKERMPSSVQEESHRNSGSGASTSLLDDTFTRSNLIVNPLLAQIMAVDEGDEELLTELQIPEEGSGDTQSSEKRSTKPLIEEL
ncbi:unnamed protein product [Allacma fusca]|uniref:Uncharacterized protein n=1 Tax=Allacma fusca TaxID=39272 RepID=A0A8J2LGB1_9HEXA|nr:unnamed protein product [Allacma fusca]